MCTIIMIKYSVADELQITHTRAAVTQVKQEEKQSTTKKNKKTLCHSEAVSKQES